MIRKYILLVVKLWMKNNMTPFEPHCYCHFSLSLRANSSADDQTGRCQIFRGMWSSGGCFIPPWFRQGGASKRLHLESSTYLPATGAWPPHIHRTISENHHESTSDIFHSATLILSCANVQFVRYVSNDQLVCLNVIRNDFRW